MMRNKQSRTLNPLPLQAYHILHLMTKAPNKLWTTIQKFLDPTRTTNLDPKKADSMRNLLSRTPVKRSCQT